MSFTLQIQKRVDEEFAKVAYKPEPNSNLDQLNLLNGSDVVAHYLQHGEYGIAFEHLRYMIDETQISLSDNERAAMEKFAKELSANS